MTTVILGGGIGGLAAAYYAKVIGNAGRCVVVLEGSNRLGGWIRTTRHEDGVLFEHGPRSIRPGGESGANTLELAEDLGLLNKVRPIKYGHPVTKNRFVLVNDELHKLPSGLLSLFKVQRPFTRPLAFAAGFKDLMTPPKICSDDSIYEFAARRFGKEVADYAIDPMTRGICAGNAREISAKAFVAGPAFNLEQKYGGVIMGALRHTLFGKKKKKAEIKSELVKRARAEKWNVWSLENGLTTLVEALTEDLKSKDVDIRLETKVIKIQNGNGIEIVTQSNDIIKADKIICALPSYIAADLFDNEEELSSALRSVPYVTVAVVNIEFPRPIAGLDPAFGFLVPSTEKVPILGTIYDTFSFPRSDGKTVLTVMMGGRWFEEYFGNDPKVQDLESIAIKELKRILKINQDPSRVAVRINQKCIPQYTVGHMERINKVREILHRKNFPISMAGAAYEGAGVNDVILSARNAVIALNKK